MYLAKLMLATCAAVLPEVVEMRPLGKAKAELPEGKRATHRRAARCERQRLKDFIVLYLNRKKVLLYLTPSVSAQDPALAPTRITEGIVPWHLNHGNFYVSGLTWVKIHARHPWLSFEDFW